MVSFHPDAYEFHLILMTKVSNLSVVLEVNCNYFYIVDVLFLTLTALKMWYDI